ncbi:MAG: restriction endonuclease subunit S [Methanobacterium sp.]
MSNEMKLKETKIGLIPEDWKLEKLGNFVIHKKGFAFKSKWFKEDGHPIVKVKDLTADSINMNECVFLDNKKAREFNDVKLKEKDILIATVGSWPTNPDSVVGKVVKVPKNASGALLNQNAVRMRTKDKQSLDQSFLYYRLKTKDFSNYLASGAQGSANQASITLNDIFSFEFLLPDIKEQKHIGKILSVLDEKIHLNLRMNQTLEEIAQSIFRHWFIQFEFPDENGHPYKFSDGNMVDSELGKIPVGWEVINLGGLISFKKGKKPKKVFDSPKKGLMPQILIDTLNGNEPSYANPKNMAISSCYDSIMVMDGANSGRLEIGYEGILGSTLAKIILNNHSITNYYLYYFLKDKEDDIKENTTGTYLQHADKGKIKKYKLVIPEKSILNRFDDLARTLINIRVTNNNENRILSEIRNSLLPKLMSGKIRVNIPEEVTIK